MSYNRNPVNSRTPKKHRTCRYHTKCCGASHRSKNDTMIIKKNKTLATTRTAPHTHTHTDRASWYHYWLVAKVGWQPRHTKAKPSEVGTSDDAIGHTCDHNYKCNHKRFENLHHIIEAYKHRSDTTYTNNMHQSISDVGKVINQLESVSGRPLRIHTTCNGEEEQRYWAVDAMLSCGEQHDQQHDLEHQQHDPHHKRVSHNQ
jgi:hypothetical protein